MLSQIKIRPKKVWRPLLAPLIITIFAGVMSVASGNTESLQIQTTPQGRLTFFSNINNSPERSGGFRDSLAFSASGLHNEEIIMNLFKGNFLDIPFDRDAAIFVTLYNAYLNAFARKCGTFLPANKVEMTTERCARERTNYNGHGMEINTECILYETVGTGLYADPALYEGLLTIERIQNADALRTVFRMVTGDDPIYQAMNMVGNRQAAVNDMETLLTMNPCGSSGLIRFAENLRLFALNRQPIHLKSGKTLQAANFASTGGSFKDQDYLSLLDDLILKQSQTWVMNRYVRGRISNVSISSRDALGRPSRIRANYIYNGFSGQSTGSVTLTFLDGLPECLYFFDFPTVCRTPDRRIVANYASEAYRK